MTCRPWRWLWGLVPMALVALLVIVGEQGRIEKDLRTRALDLLDKQGHGWAGVSFEGRDGVISGRAHRAGQRSKAVMLVRNLSGVRRVADRATLLEEASPFLWRVRLDKQRIKIFGFVPSEADRETVIGMAKASFPGKKIIDRMKLARGAPPQEDWLAGISFGFSQLVMMRRGFVEISDTRYSLDGKASDPQTYKILSDKLAGVLPGSLTRGRVNLLRARAQPFLWSLIFAPAGIAITGFTPSESERGRVAKRIGKLFPQRPINNTTLIANGVPEKWSEAIAVIVAALEKLDMAQINISDREIKFAGRAHHETTAIAVIQQLMDGLPDGFALTHDIAFDVARPPEVRPFPWQAAWDGSKLVLSGHVPAEAERLNIVAGAKRVLPGVEIDDQMTLARGVPDNGQWTAAVSYALSTLPKLARGRVQLTDLAMHVDGEAATPPDYEWVLGVASRQPPKGVTIADIKILPAIVSSFEWRAQRSARDGGEIKIGGYTLDEALRDAVGEEAKFYFPKSRIINQLEIARQPSLDRNSWRDGQEHALQALQHLSSGQVTLGERTLAISGLVATLAARDGLNALMAKFKARGLAVESQLSFTESIMAELSWSVAFDGDGVRLKGSVPDEGARAALLRSAKANFSPATINDRMVIVGVASPSWLAAAQTGLRLLSKLTAGSVQLSNDSLELLGRTSDGDLVARIDSELRNGLPSPYTGKAEIDIIAVKIDEGGSTNSEIATVSPYVWAIDVTDSSVTLSGHVPNEDIHKGLLDGIAAAFTGRRLVDQMTLAGGAPKEFAPITNLLVAQLKALGSGRASIENIAVMVSGNAESGAMADAVRVALKDGMPSGYQANFDIKHPPVTITLKNIKRTVSGEVDVAHVLASQAPVGPEACELVLQTVARNGVINFEVNSDELRPESFVTLIRLSHVAKRCNGAAIQVSGHTDSDGRRSYNRNLSERRARSVVDFLVDRGISLERLEPAGFGEERPLVANNSEANKAKNRRIEFEVRAN